jgi:hypothetical protein
MYEKQVANVSSDNHNKFGQIPDSITYSEGFNSDEDKGSSKADSSKSDTSEECFTDNDHVKNHDKQHVASQSGKPKKSIFSSSDEDEQIDDDCVNSHL